MPLYADLCVRLQNASMARLRSVAVPSTSDNLSIASILLTHGFVHNVVRGTDLGPSPSSFLAAPLPRRRLWIDLKYRDERPVLSTMRVVSKPSKRIFMDPDELVRFSTGRRARMVKPLEMGEIGIVKTRDGWREARDALREQKGGELVCRVA